MKVRYIRESMNGSNTNTGCHWCEIQAINYESANIALNKKVTCEGGSYEKGTLDMITNGNTSVDDYIYFRNDPQKTISVIVDLGNIEDIDNIKVWHYHGGGRTYKNILLETSIDGVKWVKIFNSNENGEYTETAEGKTHKLPTEEELTELNEDATLNDIVTFYEKYLENNKQNKEFLKNVLINKSANVDDNDRMFDLINKVQDIKTGVNVTINDSIKVDYDFNLTLSSVSSWVNKSTLPYDFYYSDAVVLNNEIHILGSSNSSYYKYHYKYDGSSWTQVSTLPYNFYNGDAVVLNNEIHILGSSNSVAKHYKYDGSTWTQVSTLPYNFVYGSAVVLNNEIHILGSGHSSYYKYHYKYDGSSWTQVSTLPYNFYCGEAVVLNNEIHILGSGYSGNYKYHYRAKNYYELERL